MTLRSGIDTSTFDTSIRPQDDLFRHVNGAWLATHVIPDDRASDGAFRALRDQAEIDTHALIEECARGEHPDDPDAERIGALFAAFMDEAAVEAAGASPLEQELARIEAVSSLDELATLIGQLQRSGVTGLMGLGVEPDMTDPRIESAYVGQSGLGLPDESYYREDQHEEIRTAYRAHIERMFALVGFDAPNDRAGVVMAVETAIAEHHWDVVQSRDWSKMNNPMTVDGLLELAPGYTWDTWAEGVGLPLSSLARVIVMMPSFVEAAGRLWRELPLGQWQTWLTWHTISARAPYLSSAFVEENFDFYGRTLSGTPKLRDRWKRGVSLVEGALGEALGRLYVARHFPPVAKARMDELVAKLVEAYRESITGLDWMGAETKEQALVKLDGFTPKIGYPVKWRDYSALDLGDGDLLAKVRAAYAFETDYELSRVGKDVDPDEWEMTPQTVNAYYHPVRNEIVFPAAILRPPFFDAEADDAVNYGGIGAVIGHEMGHGFDDQGSKFDERGELRDWWTDSDRSAFEERTKALIAQYDAFVPAQFAEAGQPHVNGALTIGENIGDLAGLSIALKAYRLALAERGQTFETAPVIDGFTALQRVFFSWAQVWRDKYRDEALALRMATDPHSPDEFRCNGVVANMDAFAKEFGTQPGDGLWRAPSDRVRIW